MPFIINSVKTFQTVCTLAVSRLCGPSDGPVGENSQHWRLTTLAVNGQNAFKVNVAVPERYAISKSTRMGRRGQWGGDGQWSQSNLVQKKHLFHAHSREPPNEELGASSSCCGWNRPAGMYVLYSARRCTKTQRAVSMRSTSRAWAAQARHQFVA